MSNKPKRRMPKRAFTTTTVKKDRKLIKKIVIGVLVFLLMLFSMSRTASHINHHAMLNVPVAHAALNPNVIKAPVKTRTEVLCLAKNLFYEARGTSVDEKLRVASVTLNRTKSPLYPKTICDVVYQYKQFSWTMEQSKRQGMPYEKYKNSPSEVKAWKLSLELANDIVNNGLYPQLPLNILHYATHDAKRTWQNNMKVAFRSQWHTYYMR